MQKFKSSCTIDGREVLQFANLFSKQIRKDMPILQDNESANKSYPLQFALLAFQGYLFISHSLVEYSEQAVKFYLLFAY